VVGPPARVRPSEACASLGLGSTLLTLAALAAALAAAAAAALAALAAAALGAGRPCAGRRIMLPVLAPDALHRLDGLDLG